MCTVRYDVTPCPKPRQTRADRWKQRPPVLKYRAFADRCRELGVTLESGDAVVFLLPMPASWSAKKRARMCLQPHRQKPDFDNLAKALCDAVLPDDSGIWRLTIEKRWAEVGAIVIERENSTAHT